MKEKDFCLFSLRTLLENSPDLIFIKDENLVYKGASKVFTDMVGLKNNKDIAGKTDYDIFDVELAQKYISDDRQVLQSGQSLIDLVEPIPNKNGKKCYSSTSKYIIRDENQRISGLIGVGRDVTESIELKEAREHREVANKMFSDILEADITNDKMINNNYSTLAPTLDLFKDVKFSKAGKMFAESIIHEDFQKEFIEQYNINRLVEAYNNGVEEFSHISYMLDGEHYKWYEFRSRLYYSTITSSIKIITFLKNVDEIVNTRKDLKQKAETDPLTGLWNRRTVSEKIKEHIVIGRNYNECALLFVDVDHFKDLNDSKGHVFGDAILKALADILKKAFGNGSYVGRLGGDEFIVLLRDFSDKSELESKVRNFFDMVADKQIEGYDMGLTCSVGIATNCQGKNFEQLYNEADSAMYNAKKMGRNRWAFYDE